MKVRAGFVSNSSSSSFVIALKTKKKLSKEMLYETLGLEKVKDNKLAYDLVKEFADCLFGACEHNEIDNFSSLKEYSEDYGYDHEIEMLESHGFTKSQIKTIKKLIIGSVCDEDPDNSMETVLCYQDIDFEDDNLIIKKEGGY